MVRVLPPLTHRIAEAMPGFASGLGPVVEHVAGLLAAASPYEPSVPSVLTRSKHRQVAASGPLQVARPLGRDPARILEQCCPGRSLASARAGQRGPTFRSVCAKGVEAPCRSRRTVAGLLRGGAPSASVTAAARSGPRWHRGVAKQLRGRRRPVAFFRPTPRRLSNVAGRRTDSESSNGLSGRPSTPTRSLTSSGTCAK